MPLHCTFRPNRSVPRTFNPRSVARVFCAAVKAGWPRPLIYATIDEVCPLQEGEEQITVAEGAEVSARSVIGDLAVVLDTISQTIEYLNSEQRFLLELLKYLGILLVIVRAARVVVRRLPGGAVVLVATQRLVQTVEGRLTTIESLQAANADAYVITVRAAANAREFLQTIGLV